MALGRREFVARLTYQRLVLAAAMITITLATTLLTALWVYAGAASTVSVRTALGSASQTDTGLGVSTTSDSVDDSAAAAPEITDSIAAAFDEVPYEVATSMRTMSTYTLPDRAEEEAPEELTIFAWYESLADHATLTAGAWPTPATGGPVEVALPTQAAAVLGLSPGSSITVVQRLADQPVEVVVVGTFDTVDPEGWFWRSDQLARTGSRTATDFPMRGPLVVADQATLDTAVARDGLSIDWNVGPRWDLIESTSVDATAVAVADLLTTLRDRDLEAVGPVRVETRLDEILPAVQRALVANRSMMVIPVLQLALLATYTLLLAARLLLEHRRVELALLRARGASTRQIVRLTLLEAALLVLPGATLAPILALLMLRTADGRGPFEELGDAVGTPGPSWWAVAIGAALLCGVALVVPTLGRTKTYVESQAERGRQNRRTVVQRAGGDLLLLGGAGIAYWQLRHYESPLVASEGRLTIDPLLVLGPCLVLFAAGLVALRALPYVARAAQTVAVARPTLGGALGAWQVARRPLRYSGPALLLVFALAIGAMSTAYGASWEQSQEDQATFQAGADARVEAPDSDGVVPVFGQAAGLSSLDGVSDVAAAWRGSTSVGDAAVDVLAIDSVHAPQVVRMRDDLGPALPELMAPLEAGRPDPVDLVLPGEPSELVFTVSGALTPNRDVPQLPVVVARVALTLRDAAGTVVVTPRSEVPMDGTTQVAASVDLVALANGDTQAGGALAYPLEVIGAEVDLPLVTGVVDDEGDGVITQDDLVPALSSVTVSGLTADGEPVAMPAGLNLDAVTRGDSGSAATDVSLLADGFFTVGLASAGNLGGGEARIRLSTGGTVRELPVVLDRTAASASGIAEGEQVFVTINGLDYTGVVTGVVEAFPGTDPTTGVLIADFQSLQIDRATRAGFVLTPTEWWLSGPDRDVTTASLQAVPTLAPGLVASSSVSSGLRALGATTLGALLAGFAAALAFAAVGFTVNLVIGSRERLSEFAVLRAIGLSRRQVRGMLLIEQTFLVGLGLVIGLLIGVGVSALVVPLVVISPTAEATIPHVLLEVPWGILALSATGAALLFAAIVVVASNRLQQAGLGGTLRLGEEA